MAGIYLHIPFCKRACYYCDFHFSTNTQIQSQLIPSMVEEIYLRRHYLQGEKLETIYFGGGTPSILGAEELDMLLHAIHQSHEVIANAEITLEANPDDLSAEKLDAFRASGINRLSIGIQSFNDSILTYLNRVHNSSAASASVEAAQRAGFGNISIDLIYAIPGLSSADWQDNINRALELKPQHISAYTLTVEEKTAFGKWLKDGSLIPVDESVAAEQMEMLGATLSAAGYKQYEISNFALPGFESRHNSNYWRGEKYLGIGPSAHSYNQRSRQHNVANNHLYVRGLKEKKVPAESELLTKHDQVNEYILTTLRTEDGCNLEILKRNFGYDVLALHSRYLRELQHNNLISLDHERLRLTRAGRLLADTISSDLFLVE